MPNTAILIWGTQLSVEHQSALRGQPMSVPVFLIEARDVCTKFKYHQQKLAFVLTAMREYADELRAAGHTVHYVRLEDTDDSWFTSLGKLCRRHEIGRLVAMRQNDRAPQARLGTWCREHGIELRVTPNDMFLTPAADFHEWADTQKTLQLEQFYRWQRRRLDILMSGGRPAGGRWNYDAENRLPLPRDHTLPPLDLPAPSVHYPAVKALVQARFADHPGSLGVHWLPTTRAQSRDWLRQFIDRRFVDFGRYEDAMQAGEPFLYHSALSALLNVGLLHAGEVLDAALAADVPMAAKEGFVRQIIGWREFMFGLYHYRSAEWKRSNFFEHHKPLENWWWTLDAAAAPEPPLRDVIDRLHTYGYSHHIERLMVLGNYMLLSGYDPRQAYDWFMAMYVDSYEWVMVPNVIGMSQYADGGVDGTGFATKPYVSGSNYLQKMGHWWPSAADAKSSGWTDLYWQFLSRNSGKLARNYRLSRVLEQAKQRGESGS